MYDAEIKARALALREQHQMSLGEICKETGVSKSTLSSWLRKYPLPPETRRSKKIRNLRKGSEKKPRGNQSKYDLMVSKRSLSGASKGKIAEAAILFRIAIFGLPVYGRVFDGEKADWIVEIGHTLKRLQVRWASSARHKYGLPTISLLCSNGRRKYRKLTSYEFDFLIGYDLYTDTAYVFTREELSHLKTSITVKPDAAERWDKILVGAQ